MSGFIGFARTEKVKDPQRVSVFMIDRIRHRGPDETGYYIDDDAVLAQCRLAIVNLEDGKQPIANEDGTKFIVSNADSNAYGELREELIAAGHVFTTGTDAEVILHGYEEYGKDVLDRLHGLFAFVIWDAKEKRFFGARDIFGVKPLYYYNGNGEFMFASEIKCFLDHPGFVKEVDRTRIPEYLSYEYIPYENTLFKDVYLLDPASWFEWTADSFETGSYYRMQYAIDESLTMDEWADRIDAALTASVIDQKAADVEVGAFLSSGIDSSYVVERAFHTGTPIRTFSVGYEEEQYSELPYAQSFAEELGVENIANKISAEDFFGAMGDIQYYMDEPLPNPSDNPLFFLSQNVAKNVKVALSGEGADELFGGYPNYTAEDHIAKFEARVPRGVRKALGRVASAMPRVKGRNFLMHAALEPWERNSRADYVFQNEERQKFLVDPIVAGDPQQYSKKYFDEVADQDPVTQLQYVDLKTWMVYDMVLKADRMSIANSLELRTPFLDRRVLDIALSLPADFRAAHDESKIALRYAAARRLPERVAHKPKLGFPSPLATWLREDRYYELVKEAFTSPEAAEFFVCDELMKLLDEHRSGAVSHMQKIWSFYTFIVWYREFFGNGERARCRSL